MFIPGFPHYHFRTLQGESKVPSTNESEILQEIYITFLIEIRFLVEKLFTDGEGENYI